MSDIETVAPTTAPRHARRASSPAADPQSPTAVTGHYLPALDGLRACAVAGVLAYHLGYGWASGGYLGVDLFFVLSGFLITSLLLEEWVRTAGIRLAAFWARRARRLLPALFLVLLAIALFVVVNGQLGSPGSGAVIDLSGLRGDALATLFYVANWHAIFAHQSYFAQFSAPSPLGHTWSLAIEEQFYLIWPLVLVVLLRWAPTSWRRVGVAITLFGVVVSSLLMAMLYHPGADPTRVYFGTDTRIFDMLAGATVAMVVAARPQPRLRARRALHAAAPVAAVLLGVFWVTAGTAGLPSGWMYRGGFLVCALLAALVVADVRQLDLGPLGRMLAVRPLRWVGKISYGIYLWHWPIFVYMTPARTGVSGLPLDLLRVAVTIAVSAASFTLVEQPIRRRRLSGWPRFALAPAAAAGTAAILLVATVPAVAAPSNPAPSTAAPAARGPVPVPGAGGYRGQTPISLPAGRTISPQNPLRVMLVGDSVMFVAAPGIGAALGATGDVDAQARAIDGFGLSTASWRTSLPTLINQVHPDLIVATWSWDDAWALRDPAGYRRALERAINLMLTPGNGVAGVIFVQFPPTGPVLTSAGDAAQGRVADVQRAAGQHAWQKIVKAMPAAFPGKVMYLPVASSDLLHGKFTTWLPPATEPSAPKSAWVRVRMIDNVHFCPAGVVRYADAVLADLTPLYHLPSAKPGWWDEPWTGDPRYNDPPGSCPDDHPS